MKHVILFEQFVNEAKVTPYGLKEVREIIKKFNKQKKDPKKLDTIFFPDLVNDICYALGVDCDFDDNPEALLMLIKDYYDESTGEVDLHDKHEIQGFADMAEMMSESKVNEEKINVKKEIKDLKRMGYDAEAWGDGIVVRDHTAPNPNWDGTTDYAWDPADGIYSDDSRYTGDDQSYSQFLEILDDPTGFEGEWD